MIASENCRTWGGSTKRRIEMVDHSSIKKHEPPSSNNINWLDATGEKTSTNELTADFEKHFESSLQRDWLKQKRKIMEDMGHHSINQMDMDMHPGIQI